MKKNEKKKEKSRVSSVLKKFVRWILPGIGWVVLIFIAFQAFKPRVNISRYSFTVDKELLALQELATYTYNYSDYVVEKSSRSFVGVNMPGTTRTVIIAYKGAVKAGYDLSKAKCRVNNDDQTITITLPEVKVLDNYIDADSIKTVEFNNIFNPIKNEDFVDNLQEEKQRQLDEAIEQGLFDLAESHAKEVIKLLFAEFNGYKVTFK